MTWVSVITGYCVQAYAAARVVKLSIVVALSLWCLFLAAYLINNVFVPGAAVVWEATVAVAAICMYLLGLLKWHGTPELQWYGPSAVR
eukprot:4177756-Heterocapsa_arctica.AAC.1